MNKLPRWIIGTPIVDDKDCFTWHVVHTEVPRFVITVMEPPWMEMTLDQVTWLGEAPERDIKVTLVREALSVVREHLSLKG